MDDREGQCSAGDRKEQAAAPVFDVGEDEDDDRDRHDRAGRGFRIGERLYRSRSSLVGPEYDLRRGGRDSARPRSEQSPAKAVGQDAAQGGEGLAEVEHGGRPAHSGEMLDRGDDGMPEREGVPGMQAAVAELADGAQRRQRRKLGQLDHAAEVEEIVAVDDRVREPERDRDRNDRERNCRGGEQVAPFEGRGLAEHGEDERDQRDEAADREPEGEAATERKRRCERDGGHAETE